MLGEDSIMWPPMTKKERNQCICGRIGWLPGGKPKTCITFFSSKFTKQHSTIRWLQMHKRLKTYSIKTDDSLSCILSRLPKSKPYSAARIQRLKILWSVVYTTLAELDGHQHLASNKQQWELLRTPQQIEAIK
ncbi:hypothetical protein INT45_011822 [Circinella minor]|uniref:Uncharacterized protein n=1 Tax=Circinella minor TaxID=1195481 RepID=A0A8H7S9A4_9FUNG|nr:hypothetical protein INT45_011822 [Circinella minor]